LWRLALPGSWECCCYYLAIIIEIIIKIMAIIIAIMAIIIAIIIAAINRTACRAWR
jgi:hypothetical protein